MSVGYSSNPLVGYVRGPVDGRAASLRGRLSFYGCCNGSLNVGRRLRRNIKEAHTKCGKECKAHGSYAAPTVQVVTQEGSQLEGA